MQDDLARGARIVELQRAAVGLMPMAMPGAVTADVVAGWEEVVRGYENLIELGPPASGLYDIDQVTRSLADAEEWLGRALISMHADAAAVAHLRRAQDLLHRLGDRRSAGRVSAQVDRITELRSGDVDAAVRRLRDALEEDDPHGLDRIAAFVELAELHSGAGDTHEARRLLQRARAALAAFGDPESDPADDLVQVVLDWETSVRGGDPAAAALAVRLVDGVHARMLAVRVLAALAQIEAEERPSEAATLLRRIERLRTGSGAEELLVRVAGMASGPRAPAGRPAPDPVALAGELTELSAALRAAGTPLKVLALRAGMLHARLRRAGIPALAAVAALHRAEALLGLGRTAETIDLLQAAARELGPVRHDDLGLRIAVLLARAYARSGDWPAASAVCERAIAVAEDRRGRVSGEHLREAYLRWRFQLYALGVEAALRTGDVGLALARAELVKSRWLSTAATLPDAGEPEAAALRDALKDLSREIDAARARGGVPEELLEQRRVLWDRRLMQVASRWPAAPAFDVRAFQDALAADEAALTYFWLDRRRLLTALIAKDGVVHEVLELTEDGRAALERFADAVFAGSSRVRDYRGAGALGRLLLPHDLSLLAGKQRLFVSPHRLLHAIPFAALEHDGRPLVADLAVSVLPALATLAGPQRPPAGGGLVALGVGEFGAHERPWPALPDATAEAAEAVDLWRRAGREAVALVEERATEDALRDLDAQGALAAAAVLQLCTHGKSVQAEVPMESFLVLGDSLLDGLDIAGLRLDADLVVLTACCSGQRAVRGRGFAELPADEASGLQAALFLAGTRAVAACLWPVQTRVARRLSRALHERLLAGDAADVALQRAVNAFRAGANLVEQEPGYWAPLFLTTLGRPMPLTGFPEAP